MVIPITGFPSNYLVPATVGEIVFAQGPSNAPIGDRSTIYVMPMSSAGTWTANTVYAVKNEQDAIDGAGVGSPLHRALKTHLKVNKSTKLYALPYAQSSGTAVSADGYVKISGSAATSDGVITIKICGVEVQTAVSTGDLPADICANLVAGINQQQSLPVTASYDVSKGVKITAKIAGASQGTALIGVISYYSYKYKAAGLTLSQPGSYLGMGSGATAGVDGSTTELANLTAALVAIESVRYYYVGISLNTASAFQVLASHISAKSDPVPGFRSIGICGASVSVSDAAALAVARNYERLQFIDQPKPTTDIATIIGNYAAIRAKYEQTDIAYNFDNFSGKDWIVPPTESDADYPDFQDINDALSDGVTIIASRPGASYIPMTTTTRSKNSAGTVDDWRALESHRVSVADAVLDTHIAQHAVTYQNFKLKEDELNSDGSINLNQKKIAGVLTPSQYKPFVVNILNNFYDAGKLKNIEDTYDSIEIVVDPNNGGRMQVGYDLTAINLLHQTTIRIAETSEG